MLHIRYSLEVRVVPQRRPGQFDDDAVPVVRGQQQTAAADVPVHHTRFRQVP